MEKKVSVIVPCYNIEQYIDRCVSSLVHQTLGIDQMELILVDDASQDGTAQRLARWEERYPDAVLVVLCQENGRQGRARNIGMEYVSSPYTVFVDGDDWVEPETLETLVRLGEETQVDMVIAQMGRDDGRGFLKDEFSFAGECGRIVPVGEKERRLFFEKGMGGVPGNVFRTDFLKKNAIRFLEGLAYEDNYFGAMVTAHLSSYYAVPDKLYHYYANLSSTVTSRNSLRHLERLEVEKQTLDRLCELGFDRQYREEIYGRFLKLYYLNSLHLIFQRFDELPVETLQEMREEVLRRFPDYKTSAVYEKLTGLEKGFLLTLETEMTEELWNNLARNYRAITSANSRNKLN